MLATEGETFSAGVFDEIVGRDNTAFVTAQDCCDISLEKLATGRTSTGISTVVDIRVETKPEPFSVSTEPPSLFAVFVNGAKLSEFMTFVGGVLGTGFGLERILSIVNDFEAIEVECGGILFGIEVVFLATHEVEIVSFLCVVFSIVIFTGLLTSFFFLLPGPDLVFPSLLHFALLFWNHTLKRN